MEDKRPPTAFLCHSTENRNLVARLAADLQSAGVDVWYSEWELKPGDSLRRRVDVGIEGASYFIALLTEASLRSEWAKTELDAALVRRIKGKCRLIPVLYGITDDQVPATLQGIVWVRIDSYEPGLRKLVNICHGVDEKPPIGSPPQRVREKPLENLGISTHAQRLAALLNERSEHGLILDPMMHAAEVESALGLTEDEISIAADELEELGWVKLQLSLGMGKAGFNRISPREELFFNSDLPLKGWNTVEDARVLAATAVNTGEESVSLIELDRLLEWGPRRINPAAAYLGSLGYIQASATISCHPYVYQWFFITPKTRRFASEK